MVEWKKLEDICTRITDGSHFSPQAVEQGYYMPSVKDMTSSGFDFSSCKQISEVDYMNLVKNGCKPNIGDVLVAKDGSMLKYVFPVNKEEDIVVLSSIALLTPKQDILNSAYLSYYLLRSDIKERTIRELSSKGGVPRIILKNFKKIQIPIPSLSEQQRIVGILDTFTASIDNLKEQIAQRRKQYEYYRDQLLDLEGKEGVEMMKIKDICINICSGGTPSTSHKEYYEGSVNWLRTQEVDWGYIYDTEKRITEEAIANSSAKLIPENCVIVAMYGATAAKVAINKIPLTTNQACCNLEIDKSKALYKFVFYWLCKEYLNLKAMGEGSQNNINGQKVKGYPVPLPSLSEQSRIVSILDTFESSIRNLESQLSQREKQYEYYRNKLLTFE